MNGTAKHKYAAAGFIYLFALICASFLESIFCFVLFGVLGVVFFLCLKQNDSVKVYITIAAAAFLISGLYNTAVIDSCEKLIGTEGLVKGCITEIKSPDNDTVLVEISGSKDNIPVKFTLFASDTGLKVGDRVELTVIFSDFRSTAEFEEAAYYYSKGIFLKAYAISEITVNGNVAGIQGFISGICSYLKSRLDAFLTDDRGAIIKAMFFGDKSGLSAELYENLRRSGISHLAAVSGMHLSLMAHIGVCAVLLVFRKRSRIAALVSSLFVLVLMLFFGMTVSVMRSGIMMLIYYGSAFFNRKTDTLSSISAALLVILIPSPYACRDVGLWLSVLGTIGIGVVAPRVLKRLKIGKSKPLSKALVSSLCAVACTLPVGAFCFGGISVISPVTGLAVQPFFTLILIIVPFGLLIPFISSPLLFMAGFTAAVMNKIINFLGGLSFSYIETGNEALLVCISAAAASALIAVISQKGKYTGKIIIGAFCAFSAAAAAAEIIEYDNTAVYVYSDGSSALIRTVTKSGTSFFTFSDSDKIIDMIKKYSAGENLSFVCISGSTENNIEAYGAAYGCPVCLPNDENMIYVINGEYTAYINDDGIILEINGITVGLLDIDSDKVCDIEIIGGYRKNYTPDSVFATILCDKRFYNCDNTVNSYYENIKIIINGEGGIALETG